MGAVDRRPSATSVNVVVPDTIGPRPRAAGVASKIQIDVQSLRRNSTVGTARRPSPVGRVTGPLVKTNSSLSDRSASSSTTFIEDDATTNTKSLEKVSISDMELAPLARSMSRASDSTLEVESLRSKLEMLELKLEEMTLKVHVRFPPEMRVAERDRCCNGTAICRDRLRSKIGQLNA